MHSIEFYYGFLTKYKVSKEELSYEDYASKRQDRVKSKKNREYYTFATLDTVKTI